MAEIRYAIKELAEKSGISSRTLRYYDQIGLLSPSREDNGYRSYGAAEAERLQRILLLRSCGFPLASIAAAIDSDGSNLAAALQAHLEELNAQMRVTARAIETTKKTLEGLEDFMSMNDDERFEQLKKCSVDRFEDEYGEEARALYGDAVIDAANERMLSMSKLAWDMKEELEQRVKNALAAAMQIGDAASPESRMLAEMHAQWIRVHWGEGGYTPEAHRGLVEGYLKDPRFVEYYDSACGEGATEFLRDAVLANVSD